MGIDVATLDFLMSNRQYFRGNFLMLGRQGLHLWGDNFERGRDVFMAHDHSHQYESIFRQDGWHSDDFFKYLGVSSVDSMDYSGFEGASIVHDLNKPVPIDLHNKYDTIFDGGTIEHVFDVKTVMENIKAMIKVGGTFIAVSPANNLMGHGFYQFSPELFRTVFSKDAGYEFHKFQLMGIMETEHKIMDLLEPPKGQRQEIKTGPAAMFNCVIIGKVKDVNVSDYQQSDYLREWGVMK